MSIVVINDGLTFTGIITFAIHVKMYLWALVLYVVQNWYVLGSRLGIHAKVPDLDCRLRELNLLSELEPLELHTTRE